MLHLLSEFLDHAPVLPTESCSIGGDLLDLAQQLVPLTAAPPSRSTQLAGFRGKRPGSGRRAPQDLIVLQTENAKLRELVALLQDKLQEAAEESYPASPYETGEM